MKTLIMSIEEKDSDGKYFVTRIRVPISGQYKDFGSFLETTYQKLLRDLEKSQWCQEMSQH